MPSTSRGYPYPAYSDAPDGPAQLQALASAIDADVAARSAEILGLQVPVHARFTRPTTQALTAGTDRIVFNSTSYNLGGLISLNASTGVVTLNKAGTWQISAGIHLNGTHSSFHMYLAQGSTTTTLKGHVTLTPAFGDSGAVIAFDERFAAGTDLSVHVLTGSASVSTVTNPAPWFTARFVSL